MVVRALHAGKQMVVRALRNAAVVISPHTEDRRHIYIYIHIYTQVLLRIARTRGMGSFLVMSHGHLEQLNVKEVAGNVCFVRPFDLP